MTLRLSMGGGEGEATMLEGEVLYAIAPRAYAPGSRVTFSAEVADGTIAIEGKAVYSKKREDGRFDLRMRLFNVRREDRERIAAAIAATRARGARRG
jgi:hypothetical protein